MSTGAELLGIADGGNDRARSDRADAGYALQASANRIGAMPSQKTHLDLSHSRSDILQLRGQDPEHLSRERREPLIAFALEDSEKTIDVPDALTDDDAKTRQNEPGSR